MAAFDLLIKRAKIFDGHGGEGVVGDLALKKGRVSARGRDLPDDIADRVLDAEGLWLFPGFLDVHTHYDLEVELCAGLSESVRHGTTTVVVSNCSLGLAFGALRRNGEDPIVDGFARVENVPKSVLKRVADRATWSDSKDYLDHLDQLPLGPNVVPMIPHSMLRIAAMGGVTAAVSRAPNSGELAEMERLLEKGMTEGYAGFSTDGLPFHYLSIDPNRGRRIPSQYGTFLEVRRLLAIVRRHGRLWQATPPTENPFKVLRAFLLTSGRLFGRPLKTTAVAALDLRSNRNVMLSAHLLTRLLNSRLLKGRFTLQSLAAPFTVWADGPFTPLAEEIPELRELVATDVEDRAARRKLYDDPVFEARFKAMWRSGKSGYDLARLRRLVRIEATALRRAADEIVVDAAPVAVWKGETLAMIETRLKRFQSTGEGARDAEERAAFGAFPRIEDDADVMFQLLRLYDREFRWRTTSANADPRRLKKLVMDPKFLPGFSDSGAHLTNMAFYDVNLRALKIALECDGEAGVGFMAKRLTRDAARLFDVDAGSIDPGAQADVVLIDPKALAVHDGETNIARLWRPEIGAEQLVNRSDGVVRHVFIAGERVFGDGAFADAFEKRRFGRVLRARPADPLAA